MGMTQRGHVLDALCMSRCGLRLGDGDEVWDRRVSLLWPGWAGLADDDAAGIRINFARAMSGILRGVHVEYTLYLRVKISWGRSVIISDWNGRQGRGGG